jgi:hypothetical protein
LRSSVESSPVKPKPEAADFDPSLTHLHRRSLGSLLHPARQPDHRRVRHRRSVALQPHTGRILAARGRVDANITRGGTKGGWGDGSTPLTPLLTTGLKTAELAALEPRALDDKWRVDRQDSCDRGGASARHRQSAQSQSARCLLPTTPFQSTFHASARDSIAPAAGGSRLPPATAVCPDAATSGLHLCAAVGRAQDRA